MIKIRSEIRFILNDHDVLLSQIGASDTLLEYLRLNQGLHGTKEGCAEGDCGACTVLVGRLHAGSLRYETVNSCIRLLPSLDGCHVVTIEYLHKQGGLLHPVQQALVDFHGSQCGFCTPGIVMSLYALWLENRVLQETEVETALQGNLCRCTGYQPIIKAAMAAAHSKECATDALLVGQASITERLQCFNDGCRVMVSKGEDRAILPADVDDLADLLLEIEKPTLVAGATDVGLWVTKFMRDITPSLFIDHLEALKTLSVNETSITLGAVVSYSQCEACIGEFFPHLASFWRRIGGWQVRNMGTIGGNIANGSPIGDTLPVLIALNAKVTLRRGTVRRDVMLEDFFIDYGKQDIQAGEFLETINIPFLAPNTHNAAYKISKRRDEDISSVCGGFSVHVENGIINSARLAFGGMAGIPKRAQFAEAAMMGNPWSEQTVQAAMFSLADDFTPVSDWRASAEYRLLVAKNLLLRFYKESVVSEIPVRLDA